MKRAATLLLCLCLCFGLFQHATALSSKEPELDGQLDRVLLRFDTMGACLVVIENGEITYTHCYGMEHKGKGEVTPRSGFQVGSISKMVANIGLMQLVEQGKASLDQELGELFGFPLRHPDYPEIPITLRQLMTHSAGLRDSTYYKNKLDGTGDELSALFNGPRAQAMFGDWKPGTQSVYSNFGGGLIGSLIEKLSGQTIDQYLTENVFAPLGITAAYQAGLLPQEMPLCDIYQMPSGYIGKELRENMTQITEPDWEKDYYLTAGKLIINGPDLAKLLIVLCDGGMYGEIRLLKESTVKEMRTLQKDRGSVGCDSGRGLFLNIITNDQVEGRTMYGHGGRAYGMVCAAYFDPTDRTGVVLLTNGCSITGMHNNVSMIGRAVMRVVYDALEQQGGHETKELYLVEE